MRQNVKITKRDLRQDKFTTNMLLAKDYIYSNWIYFAAGAAVIILIIAGMTFLQQDSKRKDREAIDIYNRAQSQYLNRSFQLAIVDYQLILEDYGSTSVAPQAAFELANAYFGDRNFAEAQAAFERYLDEYEGRDKYMTTSAMAGIAECKAGQGDQAAAADMYRAAAEKYPDFGLTPAYYYQAMNYYIKSGNLESARVIYAKLAKDFSDSQSYRTAGRLAAEHGIVL